MIYRTLKNEIFDLSLLDTEQMATYKKVKGFFKKNPDWTAFYNFWIKEATKLRLMPKSVLYKIFQDMEARIGVRQGIALLPCQRWHEMLKSEVIDKKFKGNVAAFCRATGISQSYMSHILAGRKALSIDKLIKALVTVGFQMAFIEADYSRVGELE